MLESVSALKLMLGLSVRWDGSKFDIVCYWKGSAVQFSSKNWFKLLFFKRNSRLLTGDLYWIWIIL